MTAKPGQRKDRMIYVRANNALVAAIDRDALLQAVKVNKRISRAEAIRRILMRVLMPGVSDAE